MAFMKTKGVMVSEVHARKDTHSCFASYVSDSIPNVSKFSDTMCCIPNGWWLSESDLQQVVGAVREFSATQ